MAPNQACRFELLPVRKHAVAPLVDIHASWDTWLLQLWRAARLVLRVLPAEGTQSISPGPGVRSPWRGFPDRSPPSVRVIVRVGPLAAALRLRAVNLVLAERPSGLRGRMDSSSSCLGQPHLADTRRCNFLPSAASASHRF